jgi:hypothetical protein
MQLNSFIFILLKTLIDYHQSPKRVRSRLSCEFWMSGDKQLESKCV